MIRLLRKLFGRRKKSYVTPPIWPYKQSKRKMKGSWEIK
jgi:hypothetical protein